MNTGIMYKTLRESAASTLLFGLGLAFVQGMLAYVLPQMHDQFASQLLNLPFVRTVVQALIGVEIGDRISPGVFSAMAWVHPVVLSVTWAQVIIFCTRLPVSEIDRGTLDVLLSSPVKRWQLFTSETLVWLCSGLVVIACGLCGFLIGRLTMAEEFRPPSTHLIIAACNLYCVYLSVGAVALLISSLSSRRGRAVGAAFGVVVASFLLNFLAQVWEPAGHVSFLCVLYYYRPFEILRAGLWPVGNMVPLVAFATSSWIAAGVIFNRRDLVTV